MTQKFEVIRNIYCLLFAPYNYEGTRVRRNESLIAAIWPGTKILLQHKEQRQFKAWLPLRENQSLRIPIVI